MRESYDASSDVVFSVHKHKPHELRTCEKSCNSTELISAYFKKSPWRRLTSVLKPAPVICDSPENFPGLVSMKQAVARSLFLFHILFILSHFPPSLHCVLLFLSVSLFYILKLSVSWQPDNKRGNAARGKSGIITLCLCATHTHMG